MEDYHRQISGNTPNSPENERTLVLWRIITRRDWDLLQRFYRMHPRCTIEHLYAGMYAIQLPSKSSEVEAA